MAMGFRKYMHLRTYQIVPQFFPGVAVPEPGTLGMLALGDVPRIRGIRNTQLCLERPAAVDSLTSA